MQNMGLLIQRQREYFQKGQTKDLSFRIQQLKVLKKAIFMYEEEIMKALKKDVNKSFFESYETEIGMVLQEINYAIKNIKNWSKPKKVKTPIVHFPAQSHIYQEPYGVVLILSPWNYPFQLAMVPLIGAIAAGNCVMMKPSELSPYTSKIIAKIVKTMYNPAYVAVVEGGIQESQFLLKQKWDYIFFTGSTRVGRLVMEAAAKHLTPVTLELGGKSPCIVDKEACIDVAAKRIVWGKLLNAGQTCVAPDYILVHHTVKKPLVESMRKYIQQFYGTQVNDQFPRIINQHHFERLVALMKEGTIVGGGYHCKNTLQIAPTLMDEVSFEDPLMQEEIFGPLLPVIEYKKWSEVVQHIESRSKPLAFYFFSENKKKQKRVLQQFSFGGGCINDTILHLATPYMPFGGIGESGMGRYHGKTSFETFSHEKSVINRGTWLDIPFRYPPYNYKLGILRKVLR